MPTDAAFSLPPVRQPLSCKALLGGFQERRHHPITWGRPQKLSWARWDDSAEEAYALLSPRWLAGGKSPVGFPLNALLAEMGTI